MRHWWMPAIAALTLFSVGCGRAPEQAAAPQANGQTKQVASDTGAPMQVVTQLLDAMRRGGKDNGVDKLLTEAAQRECQRKGLLAEPIGSPDAKFEVTRAEMVPDRTDAALVHSVWIEPDVGTGPQKVEIVWAVKLEKGQWKISGMISQGPDGTPVAVDFENGDEVASRLNQPQAQTAAAPANTAAPPAQR